MLDIYVPSNWDDIIIRLTLAVILGGIIGFERVVSNHDAGLRTHILVCLGSAGIMVLSQLMNRQYGGDIARMGAQVVSGIGFLGAGCILVTGGHVRGLTTAAGLWATACVGLIIGSGYLFVAFTMTVLMLIAMMILRPLVSKLQSKHAFRHLKIQVQLTDRGEMRKITESIYNFGAFVSSMDYIDEVTANIEIVYDRDDDINILFANLASIPQINKIIKK